MPRLHRHQHRRRSAHLRSEVVEQISGFEHPARSGFTASLLAGLIAWPATLGAARWLPDTRPGNLLVAGVGGLFFSAAYLLLVYVLQIRPVLDILAPFARRLPVLRSL